MAYSTSNPPVRISQGTLAKLNTTEAPSAGGDLWYYGSADVIGTVDAANYFSNGSDLGMAVGDVVLVFDATTPKLSLCFVKAVTAGGAASLNNTTAVTAA